MFTGNGKPSPFGQPQTPKDSKNPFVGFNTPSNTSLGGSGGGFAATSTLFGSSPAANAIGFGQLSSSNPPVQTSLFSPVAAPATFTSTASPPVTSIFSSQPAPSTSFSFGTGGTASFGQSTSNSSTTAAIFSQKPASSTFGGAPASSAFGATSFVSGNPSTEKQTGIFGAQKSVFGSSSNAASPPAGSGSVFASISQTPPVATFSSTPSAQAASVFGSHTVKPVPVPSTFTASTVEAKPATLQVIPMPDNVDVKNRFAVQQSLSVMRDKLKTERDKREEDYYKNYKPMPLLHAKSVVGTCMEMCPVYERYDREFSQELHLFEMVSGTENDPIPRVLHEKAVKKYRRSAAGKEPEIFPEDIRPPAILLKTMNYMINDILTRSDVDYLEIYNFIRDRGRAIRKDFKVQNHLKGSECVSCLERLTRFLIHSDFLLCPLPESRYSCNQNRHQVIDTLTTLMEVYDEDSQSGIEYQNESEFRSYYILLMLDDCAAIDKFQSWKPAIQKSKNVLECIKLHQTYQNGLYEPFFYKLAHDNISFLNLCIIHSTISRIRSSTLKCILSALPARERQIKLDIIKDLFLFDDLEDAKKFCEEFGAQVVEISPNSQELLVKYDSKEWPESAKFTVHKSKFVINRAPSKTSAEIVEGAPLDELPKKVITEQKPLVDKEKEAREAEAARQKKLDIEKEVRRSNARKEVSGISQELIDEVISLVMREMLPSIINDFQRKMAGIRSCLEDILNDITSQECRIIAVQEVERKQARQISVANSVQEIINEALFDLVTDISLEMSAEAIHIKNVQKRTIKKWKNLRQTRFEERQYKAEVKRRKIQNLRSIPIIYSSTPVKEVIGKLPKDASLTINHERNEILEFLQSCPNFMKLLVLSHVDSPSNANYNVHTSLGKWLAKEFMLSGTKSLVLSNEIKVGLKISTLFRQIPKNQRYPVIVKFVEMNNTCKLDLERQPNYTCSAPGTNCLLFQFLFSSTRVSEDEIRNLQNSLNTLISLAPKYSSPILIIGFWSESKDVEQQVKTILQLDNYKSKNLISKYFILHLGSLGSSSNAEVARLRIASTLAQASSIMPQPPELINAFEDLLVDSLVSQFQKHVDNVCKNADESFTVRSSLSAIDGLSHAFMDLLRKMLLYFRNAVTNQQLELCPWPFDEQVSQFPIPDIQWNSPQRHAEIRKYIDSCIEKLNLPNGLTSNDELILHLNRLLSTETIGMASSNSISDLKGIWQDFVIHFVNKMDRNCNYQFICMKSSVQIASISWNYDLARSVLSSSIYRKRNMSDYESDYKSPSKRTINYYSDYLNSSSNKRTHFDNNNI